MSTAVASKRVHCRNTVMHACLQIRRHGLVAAKSRFLTMSTSLWSIDAMPIICLFSDRDVVTRRNGSLDRRNNSE